MLVQIKRLPFFLIVPCNEQQATFGNGTQVMFYAPNADAVNAFHSVAVDCGVTDEGLPDPRYCHPEYYDAYVRDLK